MHCNKSVVLFLRLLGIEYISEMLSVLLSFTYVCVCYGVVQCIVTYCECMFSVVCRVWHSDKKGTGEDKA